jgi:uncharacterized membrane protein
VQAAHLRTPVSVIAVIIVGLLAGIHLGTGLAQLSSQGLPELAWTLRRQAEDDLFRTIMPTFMWVAVITLVAGTIVHRGAKRWWFAAAAVLALACMIQTITGEVPLNRQIAAWHAGSAPGEWTRIRDTWMHGHWIRTALSVLAFAAAVLALRLPSTPKVEVR